MLSGMGGNNNSNIISNSSSSNNNNNISNHIVKTEKTAPKRPKKSLKQKPARLISSLLEQQDIIKRQQMELKMATTTITTGSNLAALGSGGGGGISCAPPLLPPHLVPPVLHIDKDSPLYEQVWEEHCYTPHMPWLNNNKTSPAAASVSVSASAVTVLAAAAAIAADLVNVSTLASPTVIISEESSPPPPSPPPPPTAPPALPPLSIPNEPSSANMIVSPVAASVEKPQANSAHKSSSRSELAVSRELVSLLPPPVTKLEKQELLTNGAQQVRDHHSIKQMSFRFINCVFNFDDIGHFRWRVTVTTAVWPVSWLA